MLSVDGGSQSQLVCWPAVGQSRGKHSQSKSLTQESMRPRQITTPISSRRGAASFNQITAANAEKRLGFAGKSRVGLSPRPGVAEFQR